MTPSTPHGPAGTDAAIERDAERMHRHGISAETKIVYGYEGRVYDRLDDAVAYAEIQEGRRRGQGSSAPLSDR